MTPTLRRAGLSLLAVLPSLALAHIGADAGDHHGFEAGFTHPFTGTDHLLAMLAVGLWSAVSAPQTGARQLAAAPISFASLLLVGALLAWAGLTLPAVEPMVAASLLVLGLLVATRRSLPMAGGMALVGGFALFHGAAHGGELSGAAALGGMVLATALLHGAGLWLGLHLRGRSLWLTRAAGLAAVGHGTSLLLG